MKRIQFFALILCISALAACNIFKKSPSSGDGSASNVLTDRRWKLVELAGKPVADKVNGKEPFVLFQKNDNRYSATGGCNGLGGTFALLANGKIQFTQGMSTMMACDQMEIENGLKEVFSTADNYTISGDNLSLNKARMAPLARFKAVK